MYFKDPILSYFVSIISILDIFTWYFILQMITRALESKEERKDSKHIKNEKGGLDAQAQCTHCMPWHAKWKKTGSVEDAAACRTGCRSMHKTTDNFDLFALWGPKHDFKSGI